MSDQKRPLNCPFIIVIVIAIIAKLDFVDKLSIIVSGIGFSSVRFRKAKVCAIYDSAPTGSPRFLLTVQGTYLQ